MAGPCQRQFLELADARSKSKKLQAAKGKQAFVTTMAHDTPVFANVELTGRKLIVEVNSAARAERATVQMREWLGACLDAPIIEIRTLAHVKVDDSARAPLASR